jgi:hypothetical protein
MTQTGRVRHQFDHPYFLTFLLRAAAMQKRGGEKDQINAFTYFHGHAAAFLKEA